MELRYYNKILFPTSWVFFSEGGKSRSPPHTVHPDGYPGNAGTDRLRFLVWCLTVTSLWEKIDINAQNALIVVFMIGILAFIFNFLTNGLTFNGATLRGVVMTLVTVTSITALSKFTKTITYFKVERVFQKFLLREGNLLSYWCPDTLISVTCIATILLVLRTLRNKFNDQSSF